ncbi:MAG: carboxypeptidase-like regulatory domain-containing protein [Paludibacteraceae bacterium]|nr:carboxypeptidase-like regulatory domain-containing protein [Paludibacteraceae bacterium]
MKRLLLNLLMISAAFSLYAVDIKGVVLDDKGEPLPGANVYWRGTTVGVTTNVDGSFVLPEVHTTDDLISSFIGYRTDTTRVKGQTDVTIVLVSDLILDEVTITERKASVIKSRIAAFDVETIGADELCKAACCNLSEAFETNASVDVAYADAATGAKQIKLLGLSGTYVQLLQENTPGVRGLAQSYGMEYIPGPWMQSIQVSKGTSSVINGYEATTGQINVEFQKPQTTSPLAINLMLNSELHAEANLTGGWEIPLGHSAISHQHSEDSHQHEEEEHHHEHGEHCHHESLYTGLLAHYQQGFMAMDDNKDSFVDMPKTQNANLVNRWFYRHGDYTMQAFVRGETQMLVATTVIEVGVNVPNASVMVIMEAQRFGLSQLHQLRGRVGRGADQSYCILVSGYEISSETRKRLDIMCQTNDGFRIAEADLKLRGPGDLEGTQQSGMAFDLKIANIATDGQLVQMARDEAQEIIARDPDCNLPEHAILWNRLAELRKSSIDWGAIS